jgi:hypothetical protein
MAYDVMAATPHDDFGTARSLTSGWVHAFAGACTASVGLSFFFLDRSFGDFATASWFWLAATLCGFGAGALTLNRARPLGRAMCAVLGLIGLALAVFPTFLIYALLRWIALCLLFVAVARAPLMRTSRDLYFCLLTCFVAGAVTAVHSRANWLLWIYLGPACVFAGLALTLEHVGSHAIGASTKLIASAAFMAVVLLLACALFLFAPRPPVLGFGFVPPATAEHGLLRQPAGADPNVARNGAAGSTSLSPTRGQSGNQGPWEEMIGRMRSDLSDRALPGWQRWLLGRLLDAMDAMIRTGQPNGAELGHGTSGSTIDQATAGQASSIGLPSWPWLLLAALGLAWLCWRRRYALAFIALNGAAAALTRMKPLAAMKVTALMMAIGLHRAGSQWDRGSTLREQLAAAPHLSTIARHWFGESLALYYAARFGRLRASAKAACAMRHGVLDATDLALDELGDSRTDWLQRLLRGAQ